MRRAFPSSAPVDGARIPALAELFDLVRAQRRRSCALQHRDQDHADLRRRDAGSGDLRGGAVAKAVRDAGLTARVSMQSFDWRTLGGAEAHRAGDRARLPDRRGAQLRHHPARRARALAVDCRARYRRFRRLGAAPRRRRRLPGLVAALPQRQAGRHRRRQGARAEGASRGPSTSAPTWSG